MEQSILNGKRILAVDDEPDVLTLIEDEIRDACPDSTIDKATTHDQAAKLLWTYKYDLVILDIMGVNGFDLLETAVDLDNKVTMLTAHALSPDVLKKCYDMGARAYLPKDKLGELVPFLEDVLHYDHKEGWERLHAKMESYFNDRFDPNWKQVMEQSILNGKRILAVDDEPDVLALIEDEIRDACPDSTIDKATTHDQAAKLLWAYKYDLVILDIMGVNGFDLLQTAVGLDNKVAMLTAHALSPDVLKKCYDMGARAYLPKDKLGELVPFLEDVLHYDYKEGWERLQAKLESYFNDRFDPNWKDKR